MFIITLAKVGVKCTNFSIPFLDFLTVNSSRNAPICIIKATSPAAKVSPIIKDAIKAMDTSTSAFISNSVTSPIMASFIMGFHKILWKSKPNLN